jgi:hypothetical protein
MHRLRGPTAREPELAKELTESVRIHPPSSGGAAAQAESTFHVVPHCSAVPIPVIDLDADRQDTHCRATTSGPWRTRYSQMEDPLNGDGYIGNGVTPSNSVCFATLEGSARNCVFRIEANEATLCREG